MKGDVGFLIGVFIFIGLAFLAGGNKDITPISKTVSGNNTTKVNPTPSKTPTPATAKAPTIKSISPTSGPSGTKVAITGSNFQVGTNNVNFGAKVLSGNSTDGKKVTFIVPSNLTNQTCPSSSSGCYIPVENQISPLGSYSVSVSNTVGKSNTLPYKVTSGTNIYGVSNSSTRPKITDFVGPSTLYPNSAGIWTLAIESPNTSNLFITIKWGDEGTASVQTKQMKIDGQKTTTISHIYKNTGTYNISVKIEDDMTTQKDSRTGRVVVGPNALGSRPATFALSSVVPRSGKVGSLVSLQGSGFNASGTTIHIGGITLENITPENNGRTLLFYVPSQLKAGSQSVYVTNSFGQVTDKKTFTVIK